MKCRKFGPNDGWLRDENRTNLPKDLLEVLKLITGYGTKMCLMALRIIAQVHA
jgi:uncharacterized membrane protein